MNGRWWWGAAALGAGVMLTRAARRGDSLAGQAALVTGGSRGLGYLIAERLLFEGCRVAICAREPRTLERARGRLERSVGGEVIAIPCDVADPDQVAAVVDTVVARFGSIDVLVNNAAVIQVAPIETLEVRDFRDAIEIGYLGTVHATLAALPHMLERGRGRIANITSIGGQVAVPHLLPYDGAKFAAVGFSEGLRAELAGTGVSVTTVVPGLMRTGSPVHVEFRGRPAQEYRWFALGDLLPLTAMSAPAAARRIVRALRRGDARLTLTWQARVLRLSHDLAPATTTRVLGMAGRLLPGPGRGRSAMGRELRGALPGVAERALDRAGRRSNQAPAGA